MSAVHLALLAAEMQPGDEVVTASNTFIATAEAISYVGARPVFVDIDPATANIDPRELARPYRDLLASARVGIPQDSPDAESVYHLFVLYVEDRDAVRVALQVRGVQTAIHYPRPVHLQNAYAWLRHKPGSFPHTEWAADRVLSMPFFPEMTTQQVEYAARTLADIVGPK